MCRGQHGGVPGVDVGDTALEERERDGVAIGVDDREFPRIVGVPHGVVALLCDLGAIDAIRAIADAVAVDELGHGVLRALVVVRVLQTGEQVRSIRNVGVVERLDEVASDQSGEGGIGEPDDQVGLQCAIAELCDGGILVVVDRLLDRDAEGLLEVGDHFGIGVVGPIEDLHRSTLVVQSVCDRLAR